MKAIKITYMSQMDLKIELNMFALMSVLRNPKYANYPVAIYSIAGPYRSGKSFLQNLLIQYIQASQYSDVQCATSAIESFFEWRAGPSSCTKGIYILSEPFLLDRPTHGDKVALYLMDTQGLFDHETSTKNSTIIGTLGFLLSSLQCFNVKGQVQSYHLEHIYKLVEFSQKAKEHDALCSPVQKNSLLLVVRDWENEEEIQFGLHQEQFYFEKIFNSNLSCGQEHRLIKDYFNHTFGVIPGLFLPYPGRAVKKKPCFLSDLSPEFQKGISQLCDHLFLFENIVVKQINGKNVTCAELCTFIESIMPLLQKDIKENVTSFVEADVEAQYNNLVMECASSYFSEVDKHCLKIRDKQERKIFLNDLFSKTLEYFDNKEKRGSERLILEWRQELKELLSQCNIALEACLNAEKYYLKRLDEFNLWITTEAESYKRSSDFVMEKLLLKRKEFESLLREDVAVEIADQCCDYFENHCNKLLAQTKEEVTEFFYELRKQKIFNLCIGTTLVVAGVAGFVAGFFVKNNELNILSINLIELGKNKIFEKIDSTFIRSNTPRCFRDPNIDLQKYRNGKLTVTLTPCFGKVVYPLQVKTQKDK